MVVDDADEIREMLANVLSLHGFEVVAQASSGAEAVEVVAGADPDIVVMDYKMPRVDGIEATRRIRESRPNQPVILYSAYLTKTLIAEAGTAGVAVCVPKTAGVEELVREITAAAADLGG